MLIYNNRAVVGFPIYLLIVIMTSSLIIGLLTISVLNMINQSKDDAIKKEIEKILSEAENMFEYADSGTLVNMKIDFPDNLNFVVFGSLPDGINKPSNFSLDENTSNNYFYVLDDGTINSYSSHTRFSGNSTREISVLYQGSYDLILELEKEGGKSYVKIYPQQ